LSTVSFGLHGEGEKLFFTKTLTSALPRPGDRLLFSFFPFSFLWNCAGGRAQNLMAHSVKIKTHKGKGYEGEYFFILSKGNNAGKPLAQPCPNCFVVVADSTEERELLYWLCFGLWQGRCFRQFLCGSVIPFIRLGDLKKVIQEARVKAEEKPKEFTEAVELLNKLSAHQENILQQLSLIAQAKRAVIHKVLK